MMISQSVCCVHSSIPMRGTKFNDNNSTPNHWSMFVNGLVRKFICRSHETRRKKERLKVH